MSRLEIAYQTAKIILGMYAIYLLYIIAYK